VAADGTLVSAPDKQAVLRREKFTPPGPGGPKGLLFSASPVGALGWTLYVEQPVAEAFLPISAILNRALLFVCVTLAVSALLTTLVSMLYSRSLDALLWGTLRIAEGDLECRIDERASDEFGLLSRSFNDMVRRLRERTLALEDSEWRYRRMTESVRDIIFSLDGAGRVVFLNSRVETLLGVPREDILGRTIAELVSRQSLHAPAGRVPPVEVTGATLPREITVYAASGEEVILELEGERGGRFASGGDFHGVARDITQRRRMEEKLRRSEKLAALGEVATRVAHELRNAVAGITASMEMARARNSAAGPAAELDLVLSEALRAQDIVQGLLGSSKTPERQRQPCALNDAILSVIDLRRARLEAAGIRLELDLSAHLPSVSADPGQLRQVFHNLIDNAERALCTLPSGIPRTLRLRSWRAEGRVFVETADNGPGIQQQHIGRVFDPFFTTEAEKGGTGLGLAVSLAIVEAFGGDISVRGRPGEGAAFTVELPLLQAPSGLPGHALDLTGKRILVVEDESAIREFVTHFMASMGSVVDSAANGQEAVALLAGGSAYELVISDFQMPDRDGRELYEWIRASRPALLRRLIYITGDSMNPGTRAFLDATGMPYLLKPVVASVLAAEVHRTLAAREP
jgi:two-component system NtrC family sensor kinase